jgi:hypothetical protein
VGSVFICNFGIKDNVQTYRVNGAKEDLYKLIEECREMGDNIEEIPELERLRQGEWTVLLKIRVPTRSNCTKSPLNK